MKIVAISDVHGKWKNLQIPECDILISCGDYSFRGEKHMVKDFHAWMSQQPARHVVSVQGNHELWVQQNFALAKNIALKACPRLHFIDHGLVEIDGLKIFGSAWTPWFLNWAWNAQRGPEIKRLWDQIPEDIDILVTHGPPEGMQDMVYYPDGITPKERVGCYDLMQKILKCPNLKHHFFGHIHGSHGRTNFMGKGFYNVSICDEMYIPSNPVTVVDL